MPEFAGIRQIESWTVAISTLAALLLTETALAGCATQKPPKTRKHDRRRNDLLAAPNSPL